MDGRILPACWIATARTSDGDLNVLKKTKRIHIVPGDVRRTYLLLSMGHLCCNFHDVVAEVSISFEALT